MNKKKKSKSPNSINYKKQEFTQKERKFLIKVLEQASVGDSPTWNKLRKEGLAGSEIKRIDERFKELRIINQKKKDYGLNKNLTTQEIKDIKKVLEKSEEKGIKNEDERHRKYRDEDEKLGGRRRSINWKKVTSITILLFVSLVLINFIMNPPEIGSMHYFLSNIDKEYWGEVADFSPNETNETEFQNTLIEIEET